MNYLTVRGIVTKTIDYNESDKILSLLTFEKGRVSVIAKGVRKRGAKLSHCARLLYCGTFECTVSRGRNILIGGSRLFDFSDITKDIEKYYYAAHYLDVAKSMIMEDQESEEILKLLLNSLYVLSKDDMNIKLITAIFHFRLMALEGFAPHINNCLLCNNDEIENMKFSISEGGLVCCNEGIPIDYDAIKAIEFISCCTADKLFSFSIPDKSIDNLYYISRCYIENTLDRRFDKLDKIPGII